MIKTSQASEKRMIKQVLRHERCCCCGIQIGITIAFILLIIQASIMIIEYVVEGPSANTMNQNFVPRHQTSGNVTKTDLISHVVRLAMTGIILVSYMFGLLAVFNYKRSWFVATKIILMVSTILYSIVMVIPIFILVISIIEIPHALIFALPIVLNIWIIVSIDRIVKAISTVKDAPIGSTVYVV